MKPIPGIYTPGVYIRKNISACDSIARRSQLRQEWYPGAWLQKKSGAERPVTRTQSRRRAINYSPRLVRHWWVSNHQNTVSYDAYRIPLRRVFAIYQIMLGWKTCKYYYETDELPNLRPITQPKKRNRLKLAFGPLFPTANIFSWVGIVFI